NGLAFYISKANYMPLSNDFYKPNNNGKIISRHGLGIIERRRIYNYCGNHIYRLLFRFFNGRRY
ncbi:MAG: hypothetical protein ACR2IA_12450, partial [Pyrinomonadaceae bacterium]